MRIPAASKADIAPTGRIADASQDQPRYGGFLEGELLDLYGAILIVVPVALFLKSLWT